MALKTFTTLTAALLLCWSLPGWTETLTVSGGAIQVEDGDTLHVSIGNGVSRIQLSGIDAPEDTENPKFAVDLKRTGLTHETLMSLGVIATGHLKKQIADDQEYELRYDADHPDKYGRLPGELFTQAGASINDRMVADGYAIALKGGPAALQSLQQQAEAARKGLWGLLEKPTRLWAGQAGTR